MIRLSPVPPTSTAAVRIVFFPDGPAQTDAYTAWASRGSARLDARLIPARPGADGDIAAGLRALAPVVPTVFVAAGAGLAVAVNLCTDPAVSPDHLVVVGASTPPPAGASPSGPPVTVVAGSLDVDPASELLGAWRVAAPDRVTVRLLTVDESELLTRDSPVVPLLLALFRVNESFPEL